MATTQTIDATIFASTHPDIAKRISVSGVLISSVMLLIGILAFASTFELDDKSSTTSMALMVLGTGFMLLLMTRLQLVKLLLFKKLVQTTKILIISLVQPVLTSFQVRFQMKAQLLKP